MTDIIRIPYINKEYIIDAFFGNDTAEETKALMDEGEIDEQLVLETACNCFRSEWHNLEKRYGHLYGLWDDCIEPQIREWFGFTPSDRINEDRRHIYFECRHRLLEAL